MKSQELFMKRLLLPVCLCFFIASCSSRQELTKDKRTVVKFWHPFSYDSSLGRTLLGLVGDFNKKNPQWFIKAEGMASYEVLKQKLLASLIAGNQPEMSLAYESWITKFHQAKKLVAFDGLFENSAELENFKKDLFDAFLASCTIQGKLYSLPFNKSVPVLYYNKTLFARYGIAHPPQTWEEFIQVSRKLTRDVNNDGKPDIYGIIGRSNLTDFLNFLMQNNGELFSRDNRQILFNRQEGIEAMKFFAGWKFLNEFSFFYTGGSPYEYQNDFTSGRCSMIIGSCVSRSFMKQKLKFPLGTAPLFGHKKKAVNVYGTNIVLFNKATREQIRAAWAFIRWFTSSEVTAAWSTRTAYMPVRKSALKNRLLVKEFETDPELKSSIMQLNYAFLEPNFDGWHLGRQYLSEAIDNILIDSELGKQYADFQNRKISVGEFEKVLEQRIRVHLDNAAKKMRKWVF